MANGATAVSGARAPRPPLGAPGRRLLLALLVSLLATITVSVPLAYQARSARDTGPAPTSPLGTTSPEPGPTAPPVTTDSTPVQVLPTTVERDGAHLTWASAEVPDATQPLEGATLRGDVVVQLATPTPSTVVKAEFWVDPGNESQASNVDEAVPFTLGTEGTEADRPFDTRTLPDGDHTVAVRAVQSDGSTIEHFSRFRVANG
jgi:hypothetical protein